ncbi:MAG: hypothetical protein EOO73_27620 [Myxococcales bacterium]|nr:MAG: hypothetical protein EOO73_27620 [Myxococcales bacterium]
MADARLPRFEITEPLTPTPSAVSILRAPEELLSVEWATPHDFGLTAGSEGLGCEFFCDSAGRVYGLTLELLPFSIVDIVQHELLSPIVSLLGRQRRRGAIRALRPQRVPINANAVWLMPDLQTAIFAFSDTAISPPGAFEVACADTDLVQPALGVTFGIERVSGQLRWIAIERIGIGSQQSIWGLDVTSAAYGDATMDAINQIHRAYYEDAEPREFAERAEVSLASLRQVAFERPSSNLAPVIEAVRRLVEHRVTDLSFDDEASWV